MKKKVCAILLSVSMMVMVLSGTVSAAATDDGQTLTRGEVVSTLLAAADAYHAGLVESDIIKGYGDGNLAEDKSVSRVECLAMISRAFGTFPEAVGDNARIKYDYDYFTDIPEWSRVDIENMAQAGVVAGTGDHKLSPDEPVTRFQLHSFITRIWALLGSNKKDDFYNTVNKEALDNSTIAPGSSSDSSFDTVGQTVTKQLYDLVQTAVKKSAYDSDPRYEKIAKFYRSVADTKSRDSLGVSVIQPYLSEIDKAERIDDLYKAYKDVYSDLGVCCLIGPNLTIDAEDSLHYILTFDAATSTLPKTFYSSQDTASQEAYITMLTKVLILSGEDASSAAEHAKEVYAMEKTLAASSLNTEDYYDVDKIYNVYSYKELSALVNNIDVNRVITDCEFSVPKKIQVNDVGRLTAFNAFYIDDNIETLKEAFKVALITSFGDSLTTDYVDIVNDFTAVYQGTESADYTPDEMALYATENMMSGYLSDMYAEKYCTEKTKNDVENMAAEIISTFKVRIENLTWMSAATKEKAVKKLNNLVVKVAYPDVAEDEQMMDYANITYEAGKNSYFNNVCEVMKLNAQNAVAVQQSNMEVDRDTWYIDTYTVNAFYDPASNSITIPAGILQGPFYSDKKSYEQNLGAIGTIIAHEITHAFDNNGAKYDEIGNVSNWWTDADYQKFQKLCQKVIDVYENYEVAPGIYNNGTQTLSENIADLGGLSCALDVVGKRTNPDYKSFFESFANTWYSTSTRQYLKFLEQVDIHSFDKARVNRGIINFSQFYTTYDVGENDGMYIPEEERVIIW